MKFLFDKIFEITFFVDPLVMQIYFDNNNKKKLKLYKSIREIHFVAALRIVLIFLVILLL